MKSFRVYYVPHQAQRVSGSLVPRYALPFDPEPPAAYGRDEDDVLAQLETLLIELEAEGGDVDRFLWEEAFEVRTVVVEVNPLTIIGKRPVIGTRTIPLEVCYCWTRLDGAGGYQVMMPRFGWWFVLEDLADAVQVIRQLIAGALSGEHPKWLFDFRHHGPEHVVPWRPAFLARRDNDDRIDAAPDLGKVLPMIAEELVGKAVHKRLSLPVGDDPIFLREQPQLERRPAPSILLVGASGVGKTTFVHRMARYFLERARGKRGERRDTRLWATSTDRIIAGMIYLGMWQERCLEIIEELSHEGHYLYVDRLTDLLRPQPGGASVADMLVEPTASGEISLVAECDEAELERCRQRLPGFVDAFHLVRLHEADHATTLDWIDQYSRRRRPDLDIMPDAHRRAIAHLDAFRPDTRLPGKAFRFVDWLHQQGSSGRRITPREMSEAFSRYSGLPVELISDDIPAGAERIADKLRARVVGQDHAVHACARALARLKARINDPDRPVATLFFAGPTGVGKTELAKQLARYLFGDVDRLVRIDMSELMAPGSSQRLLDVSPGVVSLASRVARESLSVVLFDEVEKAHREVFDLLLGVLGEGRLTDSSGRLVDFRMTVLVMTSNLGAGSARALGFGERSAIDHARSVAQHFRPEFVNRLDHVIAFRQLDTSDVERIVDLELASVAERVGLTRRRIALHITPQAREMLANLGYDPEMGARPLKRVIEERVVTPIAVRLAGDPSYADRSVRVVTQPRGPDDLGIAEGE